jgi:hypothetical protein
MQVQGDGVLTIGGYAREGHIGMRHVGHLTALYAFVAICITLTESPTILSDLSRPVT